MAMCMGKLCSRFFELRKTQRERLHLRDVHLAGSEGGEGRLDRGDGVADVDVGGDGRVVEEAWPHLGVGGVGGAEEAQLLRRVGWGGAATFAKVAAQLAEPGGMGRHGAGPAAKVTARWPWQVLLLPPRGTHPHT